MVFITLLIITALAISSIAGFFSIWGLAQLFQGAFWPVVAMGSSLELGKLISASYIYRFWNKINIILKSYLILAILILMMVTSAGIFGFLSSAYQSDTMDLVENTEIISELSKEKNELLFRKRQIDKDIASLPSNFVRGREKLMKSYGPEISKINKRLDDITEEIRNLKIKKIKQESHIGPIIYMAKALGKSTDDATKYMILLLIIVFDPLAVILVIGTNIAIDDYRKQRKEAITEIVDDVDKLEELKTSLMNEIQAIDHEKHEVLGNITTKDKLIDTIRRKAFKE